MCGIAGIYNFNAEPVASAAIERMTQVIRQRGPDDHGIWAQGEIGLGNRRLSILDLSADGHQPMSDETGTIWVAYNGEIYNYRQINEELKRRGHRFKSRSDTETIIHAYQEYGEDCVEHFNGMFAFALWDAGRRQLFLARDRLGIKPLYYFRDAGRFIFASEVRSIVASGLARKELSKQAIHHFLTLGYVPEPWSIYEGITPLPPAHRMVVGEGQARLERYWDPFAGEQQEADGSFDSLAEQVRSLLADAVRLQQISDVPLGVFLSGGLDSTSVAALMARSQAGPVRTFTLASTHPRMDESSLARLVAERYQTEHLEYKVTPQDIIDSWAALSWAMDQPQADFFETYFVSRLAARQVKVALSGAGGDELFAGYHGTRWQYRLMHPLARLLPGGLLAFLQREGERYGLLQAPLRLAEICRAASDIEREIVSHGYREQDKLPLYSPAFLDGYQPGTTEDYLRSLFPPAELGDIITRFMAFDLSNYLRNHILPVADNGGMAHSLEIRVPLLDHRLVELAARVPARYKFRRGESKVILKAAVHDLLPPQVLHAPKRGFGIPRPDFIRHELKPTVLRLLSEESVARRKLFRPAAVQAVLSGYYRSEPLRQLWTDFQRVWNLVTLELWLRVHVDNEFTAAPEISLEEI
jgi:asparagine synthase (glutamine-hydrolysing)